MALIGAAMPAAAADVDLLLAVELNGHSLETVVEAKSRDGKVFVRADDFAALGLKLPPSATGKPPDTQVPLDGIPGVTYSVDGPRQVLLLKATDAALLPKYLNAPGAARPPDPSDFGALLNYDVYGTSGVGGAITGLLDGRLNVLQGTLESSELAEAPANHTLTRLSTTFTYPEYENLRTWQVGDLISGGLTWTRPYRLGGVQVQTNYSMRPDLVTYPLPDLSGHAAVPSTVDVLVNGVRQFSSDVPRGPFDIRQPPIMNGAGEFTVVTRDATGQQTTQTVPFYVATSLLTPGLASYSVEAGVLRTNYGAINDEYHDAAGSATLRYGIEDWLTGETHTEAGAQVQTGGIGVAVKAAHLGVATFALAASRSNSIPPGFGAQFLVGFEHVAPIEGFSVSYTARTSRFRDLPTEAGDPVPRSTLRANVSVNLPSIGTLSAAYVDTRAGLVPTFGVSLLPTLSVGNSRVGSITYSRQIGDYFSLYATAFRDFAQRNSAGVLVGISAPLGSRSSASVQAERVSGRASAEIDASQAAVEPGEFGASTRLSTDPASGQSADATYMSQYGTVKAGVGRTNMTTSFRGELTGAVVTAGGGVYATNTVNDAYGVVDTDGLANVPVLVENRLAGRTGGDGTLLVPNLRSWDDNRISVDPLSLPADAVPEDLNRTVHPVDRGSLHIEFKVTRGSSALIRLVDDAGKAVPLGSVAVLERTHKRLAVGYEGEVFATGLAGKETLTVSLPKGQCVAHFKFVPVPGDLPTMGPIICARGGTK